MIGSVLIVLVVVAAVWMVGASRPDDLEERGAHRLRRVLQYLFLLIAVFSAANGVSRVLTAALPVGRRIAGPGPEELALGLSLTLVFVPLWTVLWRIVRRGLSQDAAERASREWSAYLAIVTATSLTITLVNAVQVGAWALGAADLDAPSLSAALVWGAVWGLHVVLLRHPTLAPTATRPAIAVLAGSAVGVVALALGAGGLLSYGLNQAYRAIADSALVEGATTVGYADSASEAILGIAATRPDAVVLDIGLAEGSGFDVLRALRERAIATDVYLLSNFATPAYRRIAARLGARAFFDKSTEFNRVRDALAARAATLH